MCIGVDYNRPVVIVIAMFIVRSSKVLRKLNIPTNRIHRTFLCTNRVRLTRGLFLVLTRCKSISELKKQCKCAALTMIVCVCIYIYINRYIEAERVIRMSFIGQVCMYTRNLL